MVTELGDSERPYLEQFGGILIGKHKVEPSSFTSSSINPAAAGIDIDQGWLDPLHAKVAMFG